MRSLNAVQCVLEQTGFHSQCLLLCCTVDKQRWSVVTFLPLRLVTSYPVFILFAISARFIRCHILHSSVSLYPQRDQHPQTTSSVQQTQADCLSEHSILIHSKGAKRPVLWVRFPHIQQIYQWRVPGGLLLEPLCFPDISGFLWLLPAILLSVWTSASVLAVLGGTNCDWDVLFFVLPQDVKQA